MEPFERCYVSKGSINNLVIRINSLGKRFVGKSGVRIVVSVDITEYKNKNSKASQETPEFVPASHIN